MMTNDLDKARLSFWNERASLDAAAGTNDAPLKRLEMRELVRACAGSLEILDAGCGSGMTAIAVLAANAEARVSGFDYSESMLRRAEAAAEREGVRDRLSLAVGELAAPPFADGAFDVVYTERALINLDDLDAQVHAVCALARKVRSGGRLLLCESFHDGLDEINVFRQSVGLATIEAPWHNRYLRLTELLDRLPTDLTVIDVSNFSSTYYFLSRVVNAWLAKNEGREPEYESPVNLLAMSLPQLGVCAQTKLISFRRS